MSLKEAKKIFKSIQISYLIKIGKEYSDTASPVRFHTLDSLFAEEQAFIYEGCKVLGLDRVMIIYRPARYQVKREICLAHSLDWGVFWTDGPPYLGVTP